MIDLLVLVRSELEQNPLLEVVGRPSAEATEPAPVNRDGKLVLPDLILQQVGAEYVVTINHGAIPLLRISEAYEPLVAQEGVSEVVGDYVRAKIDAAMRLIESLEQRQKVLLAVGRAIIKFQADFLENRGLGSVTSMPLSRVDVPVGIEETDVRRMLPNKYIETAFGVFELVWFFAV